MLGPDKEVRSKFLLVRAKMALPEFGRRNAETEEALETSNEIKNSTPTQTTERVDISNNQENETSDITEDVVVKATEKVADEYCSDQEYCGPFKVVESDDTITYEIECWDPGNKWIE